MSRFAMIPVEIASAKLTARQMRVLIALYAHKTNENTVCPSRKRLSELTGLPEDRVSVVTTELERLGLIEKCGNGGSQTTRYTLLAGGRK